jgi:prepilin-type N-terminal cleavage/methylation domain-containing protein
MKKKNIFVKGLGLSLSKGFTLIEVLVVIVIIGVLSAIVLSASNSARVKAEDLAIKANLDSVRTSAEFYYDTYNSYGTTITSYSCTVGSPDPLFVYTPIYNALLEAERISNNNGLCILADSTGLNAKANSWAISVPLKSDPQKSWCVDSSGFANIANASYDGLTNKAFCSIL